MLVLEAGKPEMLFTDIPALAPYFQSTDYSWQYYMEREPGVCMGKYRRLYKTGYIRFEAEPSLNLV